MAISILGCEPVDVPEPPQPTGPLTDTTILNIPYGSNASQKFDLGLPAGRTSATALVVAIHGGGWSTGDKAELNWMLNGLKKRGFAVANINYQLVLNTPDNYKMQMDDVDSAVKFVLRTAAQYTFNGDKAYMAGHSAGGHLALCYTYSRNSTGKIKAVASLAGPTNLFSMVYYNAVIYDPLLKPYLGVSLFPITPATEDRYKSTSPFYQATASSAATIFLHGEFDPVVNIDQSTSLSAKLLSLGVDKKMISYPLTFHDWWTDPTKTNNTLDEIKAWFNGHP